METILCMISDDVLARVAVLFPKVSNNAEQDTRKEFCIQGVSKNCSTFD